jgi:hypothetical protein
MAAEAAAHARADLAARGLIGTVMQDFYGMAAAARKLHNADLSVADAQSFLDITGKQEKGGEVAHSDTVKATSSSTTASATGRKRSSLSIRPASASPSSCSPITRPISPSPTISTPSSALPVYSEIQTLAGKNSPDIRAAQAAVTEQISNCVPPRPTACRNISADYFFGIERQPVRHPR